MLARIGAYHQAGGDKPCVNALVRHSRIAWRIRTDPKKALSLPWWASIMMLDFNTLSKNQFLEFKMQYGQHRLSKSMLGYFPMWLLIHSIFVSTIIAQAMMLWIEFGDGQSCN